MATLPCKDCYPFRAWSWWTYSNIFNDAVLYCLTFPIYDLWIFFPHLQYTFPLWLITCSLKSVLKNIVRTLCKKANTYMILFFCSRQLNTLCGNFVATIFMLDKLADYQCGWMIEYLVTTDSYEIPKRRILLKKDNLIDFTKVSQHPFSPLTSCRDVCDA